MCALHPCTHPAQAMDGSTQDVLLLPKKGIASTQSACKTSSRTPLQSSSSASATHFKLMALVILVIQNSALALTMRLSRTSAKKSADPMYLASTAVVLSEVIKLVVSTCLVVRAEYGWTNAKQRLYQEMIGRPEDMGKLLVPSLLYVIQNNLGYVAMSNLDAATFQVLYQLKILTTALFSVFLLGRHLALRQWLALLLLICGVSIVQLAKQRGSDREHTSTEDPSDMNFPSSETNNPTLGLICILLACISSGFAGVYFEKVLKSSKDVSVWVRNVQLALIGIMVGLVAVCYTDAAAVRADGFFQGYSLLVWTVVGLQALGGIMVALVVKYADSVLKGFATSVSIVVSFVLSLLLFQDAAVSFLFLAGTTLVISSTILYSIKGSTPKAAIYTSAAPNSGVLGVAVTSSRAPPSKSSLMESGAAMGDNVSCELASLSAPQTFASHVHQTSHDTWSGRHTSMESDASTSLVQPTLPASSASSSSPTKRRSGVTLVTV